jgi:sugar lactone lactonase YvrE
MMKCFEDKCGMTSTGFSIFDSTSCALGEGPTYDPDTDTAWWFDIDFKSLLERNLRTDETTTHALPVMASALAVIDAERQLLVCEDGLYIRQLTGGSLSLLTPLEADNSTTRSNDSRVHPCGAFWIGTMGKHAERGAGAIYHFFRGEIRQLYSNITISNAICFSSDGATGYFTDTITGQVMRVALDANTGLPVDEPTVFLDRHDDIAGHPDGAVIDADGLLWNARWDASSVMAFDASGSCVETIELPATQITCPAFIGGDRMIVTSAATGLSEQQLDEQPQAGQTFLVDRRINTRYEPKVLL